MINKNDIEHKGKVVSIEGNKVCVEISSVSACAGCHARSLCSASDEKRKIIEAYKSDGEKVNIGDEIYVVGQKSYSYIAVLLAYVVPVMLLVGVLVIADMNGTDEGIGGLMAIGILIPYYLLLYMLRRVMYNKFKFKTKNQII